MSNVVIQKITQLPALPLPNVLYVIKEGDHANLAITSVSGELTPIRTASTFVHEERPASALWTIAHGMGRRPSVTIVDSAGTVVIGRVKYVDQNTIQLTFSAQFSGTAYLN